MEFEETEKIVLIGFLTGLTILGIAGLIVLTIWLVWGSVSLPSAILSGVAAYFLSDKFEKICRRRRRVKLRR